MGPFAQAAQEAFQGENPGVRITVAHVAYTEVQVANDGISIATNPRAPSADRWSRAIGETAPLIVVGAATVVAFNASGVNDLFTAMPIQIFDWITRPSNDVNNYAPLAAAGILLLMILLLLMNSVAIWLRNRYEQKW